MLAGAYAGHNPWLIGALFCAATLLWSVFHIIVHELSHAFVARALGKRVFRVTIGTGKPILRCSFFGIPVSLGPYASHGGATFYDEGQNVNRVRHAFLITAAGPLADALLLLALIPFCGPGYSLVNITRVLDGPAYLACAFAIIQIASLIRNLVPWTGSGRVSVDGVITTGTDGHTLFSYLFSKKARQERRGQVDELCEALRAYNTGEEITGETRLRATRNNLALSHFNALVAADLVNPAVSVVEWLLEQPIQLNAEKVLYYDLLASLPTMSYNGHARSEDALNKWHASAVECLGREPVTLEVTRGILLIFNERYEEGEEILIRYHQKSDTPHDRFGCCLHMAVSRSWQADFDSAKEWLEKAKAELTSQQIFDVGVRYMKEPPRTKNGEPRKPYRG